MMLPRFCQSKRFVEAKTVTCGEPKAVNENLNRPSGRLPRDLVSITGISILKGASLASNRAELVKIKVPGPADVPLPLHEILQTAPPHFPAIWSRNGDERRNCLKRTRNPVAGTGVVPRPHFVVVGRVGGCVAPDKKRVGLIRNFQHWIRKILIR